MVPALRGAGGDHCDGPDGSWPARPWAAVLPPLIAAVLATAAVAMGWRGVDLPAHVYRVGLFHRSGLTLWDSQWYGGHWTLGYSVIFPPIAGVLGVQVTEVASAAVAAWAFDRLVVTHFGRHARIGSVLFAVGTLAQVAIGQLPFLLGEALALSAYLAATRRRSALAVLLGVAAMLASPLAGAFLVLVAASWLVTSWPRRRIGLMLLVAAPSLVVLALAWAFPGEGRMPFPLVDFLQFTGVFVVLTALVPRRHRGVQVAAAFYLAATAASFLLPTPMGGNITRLGECLGTPLAACLLWPHRRRLLAIAVVPLQFMVWRPAFATFPADSHDRSADAAYFAPVLDFLGHHREPLARVEMVPTRRHWEAAYAAPVVALARGWERQLDTADNPIFYRKGALQPAAYRAWLVDNGVRYVAVPDADLDYAAVDERRLVAAGVPGLRPVWGNEHWQVYEVDGSPGIVEGPARLVRIDGEEAVLQVSAPGPVLLRVRFSARWGVVAGGATLREAPGDWTEVDACRAGEVRLRLHLIGADNDACPVPSREG